MKKAFKKFVKWLKRTYVKLSVISKKYIDIAVNVVEAIKKIQDSPVDDIILFLVKMAIPGDADDKLINRVSDTLKEWIPKILLDLRIIDSIANIEDPNEQLKAVLAELKFSSVEAENVFYHSLAALIMEKLSDGKITWSEAVRISEYYYQHVIKK